MLSGLLACISVSWGRNFMLHIIPKRQGKALKNSLVMQLFMTFHGTDIIAVKQPINLLPGECYQLILWLWPLEFFL